MSEVYWLYVVVIHRNVDRVRFGWSSVRAFVAWGDCTFVYWERRGQGLLQLVLIWLIHCDDWLTHLLVCLEPGVIGVYLRQCHGFEFKKLFHHLIYFRIALNCHWHLVLVVINWVRFLNVFVIHHRLVVHLLLKLNSVNTILKHRILRCSSFCSLPIPLKLLFSLYPFVGVQYRERFFQMACYLLMNLSDRRLNNFKVGNWQLFWHV